MKVQFERFSREYKWNVINRYNKIEEEEKVDVSKSVIYDDYFEIVAGESAEIKVRLMSNKQKVYIRDDVEIETKVVDSKPMEEKSQNVEDGDRVIEMTSTKVGKYEVEIYVNKEKM